MTTTTTYPEFVRLGPDLISEIVRAYETERQPASEGIWAGHRLSKRQLSDRFRVPKKMMHEILGHPQPVQVALEAALERSQIYGPQPSRKGWHLHPKAFAIERVYREGERDIEIFAERFPDLRLNEIRNIICAMTGDANFTPRYIQANTPERSAEIAQWYTDHPDVHRKIAGKIRDPLTNRPIDNSDPNAAPLPPPPEVEMRVQREIVGVWRRGFTIQGEPATREQEMTEMETLFALPRRTIIGVLNDNGYSVALALDDSRETQPPRRWNFIRLKT